MSIWEMRIVVFDIHFGMEGVVYLQSSFDNNRSHGFEQWVFVKSL